jgi:hypothetical protein
MNRREFLKGCSVGATLSALPSSLFAQTPGIGFRFVDVTAPAGLQFRHVSGAYGGKLLPETLGSGCAFIDYDADGWPDILLVSGMEWPGAKPCLAGASAKADDLRCGSITTTGTARSPT